MTAGRARYALLLLLTVAVLGCSRPAEPLYQEQLYSMGSLVEITIWGAEHGQAVRAAHAVGQSFDAWHRAWSPHGDGPLGRLNQALAASGAAEIPPEVQPLLGPAQALARASGERFNPAIGRLIDAWGFGGDEPPTGPPPAAMLQALVAQAPSSEDWVIEGTQLRARNPAVQLDFGAYAQGYGADRAVEQLRAAGIENAIINVSGDIRVIGRRGDRPWRIGIRNPQGPGMLAAIDLEGDESIVTSGDYERYFEYQGRRYHHILDPRTGYPSQGLSSVTVLHAQATVADAAATALMVAGLQDWQAVAKQMGIRAAMVVGNDGTVYISPAMAKRLQFETKPPRVVESAL